LTPINCAVWHDWVFVNLDPGAEIQELKVLWYEVHQEDHAICERMQNGRHSHISIQGGVLSQYWENKCQKPSGAGWGYDTTGS
jgi:hypothetical protein